MMWTIDHPHLPPVAPHLTYPLARKNELSSTSHFTGTGYPVSKKHIWIQGGSNHLHEKTAKIEKST